MFISNFLLIFWGCLFIIYVLVRSIFYVFWLLIINNNVKIFLKLSLLWFFFLIVNGNSNFCLFFFINNFIIEIFIFGIKFVFFFCLCSLFV